MVKMKKKKIFIISAIVLATLVLIANLYQTFALSNTITEGSDAYNVTVNNNSSVTVPANSEKTIYYRITNTNNGKVRYGVGYTTGNIVVKVYDTSRDTATGLINYGESKFIKLRLINNNSASSSVTISTILGYEHGGDLIVPSGVSLVNAVYNSSSGT